MTHDRTSVPLLLSLACASLVACGTTPPPSHSPGLSPGIDDGGVAPPGAEATVAQRALASEGTLGMSEFSPGIDDGVVAPLDAQGAVAERARSHKGKWELTLGGSGSSDKEFDAGGFAAAGSVGYYLTDSLELVGRQNVDWFDTDTTSSVVNGSTRVALDFHLGEGDALPFIGFNFGWVYGDTVNETLAAAPEVGIKIDVRPDTFVFAMAEYQFFFDDSNNISDSFDDGAFVYSLGLGTRF